MDDVKRLRMQRRASIHHDGWEYLDCVLASAYDALGAENVKLREALNEACDFIDSCKGAHAPDGIGGHCIACITSARLRLAVQPNKGVGHE